jgi:hypothetical protein
MPATMQQSLDLADTLIHVGISFRMSYDRSLMPTFDYTAPAGLFSAKSRSGLRYRRFPHAAEAISYAIEKLPRKVFLGTSLEVNDERYSAAQIRALYESERYPLTRKDPSH